MMATGVMMLAAGCGSDRKITQAKADEAVVITNVPCSECKSTADIIRSTAMRESMDQQMAKEMARSSALEDLASKINVTVKSVVDDYRKSSNINMTEEMERRFEGNTRSIVDQTVRGYRTACEKYTVSTRSDGRKIFKCYYAVEIDKEDVAKSLYQALSRDEIVRLDYDYEHFRQEFNRQMTRNDNNR